MIQVWVGRVAHVPRPRMFGGPGSPLLANLGSPPALTPRLFQLQITNYHLQIGAGWTARTLTLTTEGAPSSSAFLWRKGWGQTKPSLMTHVRPTTTLFHYQITKLPDYPMRLALYLLPFPLCEN